MKIRSGRTGRAGRKGICVTLFSPRLRGAVCEIEAAVGNKFEWAGAPQPMDIVASSAENCMEVRPHSAKHCSCLGRVY